MIPARYLLLVMAVFLAALSFVWSFGRAEGCPTDEASESSSKRVRRLLSDSRIDDPEAASYVFKEGGAALPTLIKALRERGRVLRASLALACLAGPKEREILAKAVAAEEDPERKWAMASFLVGALVRPSSDDEWRFLGTCLIGYDNDDKTFASFSAALALGVNASPRALSLLEDVKNPDHSPNSENDALEEITQAILWIKQRSSSMGSVPLQAGTDSEQIEKAILHDAFFVSQRRDRFELQEIVFGPDKRDALVSMDVYASKRAIHEYDIKLDRRSGMWTVTGVWFVRVGDLSKTTE